MTGTFLYGQIKTRPGVYFTLDNSEMPSGAANAGAGTSEGSVTYIENPYELPTMSETIKGGAKVGHGLVMTQETLNAAVPSVSSTLEGALWIEDD